MRISWSKKEKENIKGKRQTITLKINRHQVKYVSKINFINLHNTWKNWLFSLKERSSGKQVKYKRKLSYLT